MYLLCFMYFAMNDRGRKMDTTELRPLVGEAACVKQTWIEG